MNGQRNASCILRSNTADFVSFNSHNQVKKWEVLSGNRPWRAERGADVAACGFFFLFFAGIIYTAVGVKAGLQGGVGNTRASSEFRDGRAGNRGSCLDWQNPILTKGSGRPKESGPPPG